MFFCSSYKPAILLGLPRLVLHDTIAADKISVSSFCFFVFTKTVLSFLLNHAEFGFTGGNLSSILSLAGDEHSDCRRLQTLTEKNKNKNKNQRNPELKQKLLVAFGVTMRLVFPCTEKHISTGVGQSLQTGNLMTRLRKALSSSNQCEALLVSCSERSNNLYIIL